MKRVAQFEKVSQDNFVSAFMEEFNKDKEYAVDIYNSLKLPKRATKGSQQRDYSFKK